MSIEQANLIRALTKRVEELERRLNDQTAEAVKKALDAPEVSEPLWAEDVRARLEALENAVTAPASGKRKAS